MSTSQPQLIAQIDSVYRDAVAPGSAIPNDPEKAAIRSLMKAMVDFAAALTGGLAPYGCMVLFPGKALQVQHMSVGLPLVGTVIIVAALAYLDHVMGEREPPPWSHQFIQLLVLLGMDGLSRRAAFMLPPAAVGDGAPPEDDGRRGFRLLVLTGAIAVISGIAGFILTNSAGAAV